MSQAVLQHNLLHCVPQFPPLTPLLYYPRCLSFDCMWPIVQVLVPTLILSICSVMTGFRFCYSLSLSPSLFCFLWQQSIHGWCPWRRYANASITVWGSEINPRVFWMCRQIFIDTNGRSRKVWAWWQQRFITTQLFISDKMVIWEEIHTGDLKRLENFGLTLYFKETHRSFNSFC